ncbi:MAG: DNA glycosylase [Verrucomicrobiota bacterium]
MGTPTMQSMAVRDFDLAETLDSGQVFHWLETGDGGFVGCIGDVPVVLRQQKERLMVSGAVTREAIQSYLRLDQTHEDAIASLSADDEPLQEAMAFCSGLRILRQPSWECLATFITSSLKQVAHIRQISLELRRRFGERRAIDGHKVFAYPTPQALSEAGETELRSCGLGYRAKSLFLAADAIAGGQIDLRDAEGLPNEDAKAFLCQMHGVGPKIADCALLFGFDRLSAFPVDVWIERILRERYFPRRRKPLSKKELEKWALQHFGDYGGLAQQFLFHFARKGSKKTVAA